MTKYGFKFSLEKQNLIKIRNKIAEKSVKFFLINYSKEGTNKSNFTRWKDRKKDTGKKILFRSGDMKSSFHIKNINANKVQIMNTMSYSGYHQDGTDNLPQREILYQSDKLDNEIEDLIVKELDKIFLKK